MNETLLPRQPWMRAPETRAVMDCLTEGDGDARFVGGCVRDALLGRHIGDIDIATPLKPEQVVHRLELADIRCVPTGLKHGTITAIVNHVPFEITTLRRDVETDGRHAVVAFTNDWQEDASRRDFTMNALSMGPDGRITDFFGGIDDAKDGHIRFVGNAKTRLEEDVLRLLRYFRFYARYSRTPPDAEAMAACQSMAPKLPRLASERVRVELLKLLSAENPVPALTLMRQCGIFSHLSKAGPFDFDENSLDHLSRLIALETELGQPDPVRRLSCLYYDGMDYETGRSHAAALRLSNAEQDQFGAILKKSFNGLEMTDPDFFQAYFSTGPDHSIDCALVGLAVEAPGHWHDLIKYARRTGQPEFQLKGRDAESAGIPPGREMGRLLKQVKNWWISKGFQPDLEACRDHMTALAKETAPS